MSEPKFTKRPWKSSYSASGGYDCMSGAFTIHADGEQYHTTPIAVLDARHYGDDSIGKDESYIPTEELQANARLIRAAPEMYVELERLVDWIRDNVYPEEINLTGHGLNKTLEKAEALLREVQKEPKSVAGPRK